MHYLSKLTFSFVILLLPFSIVLANNEQEIKLPYVLDFKKIEDEKKAFNYNLNELVTIIEDSIRIKNQVIIPNGVNEFERAVCVARRIQHNDSQLVAIKFLKTLLEFECYRTEEEKLYLRLLMGNSLNYIGAPQVAHSYMKGVFPNIFNTLTNPEVGAFLYGNYAGFLIKIDSTELAKKIFLTNFEFYKKVEDTYKVYTTRNDLGYTYMKQGKFEAAKRLYKINQAKEYSSLNPVLYAFSFGNYGNVLLHEKAYDSALYYMKKEVFLLHKANSEEGLINTYAGIGDAYKKLNLLDSAKHYYSLALEESKDKKALKAVVENYKKLLNIYSFENHPSELAPLLTDYFKYNDSLSKVINFKTAQNDFQVSQFLQIFSETENSRKKTERLEVRNRELIYTTIALIIVIFLLILVISVRNVNRKQLKEKNTQLKENNIEQEKSYQAISESNKKNEILLKELHHRVKNNLQIISSLFNLQLNATKLDVQTEKVFKDAKNRIYSISLIHKKIYQSNNVDSLNFEEYIRDFSDELLKATPNEVNIDIDIQRNPISIESAIPLGLIFNELFTNSLKHAKRHDLLKISIKHEQLGGKEKLIYTDNGVGVQNIEVMKDRGVSIGVTLIHLLGDQLGATIKYKEANKEEHGFWLSIEGNFE